MKKYQIMINDRNYSSWVIFDTESNKDVDVSDPLFSKVNPVEKKMFTRDVFTIDETNDNSVNIAHSPTKNISEIAGVLLLENNKTFGRTENKKRLLYKCIPDDAHLPAFLIPYDIQMGFSKVNKNKFVIFKFDHWKDKHPHGLLVQTLGNIDNLEIFYEYQLYCRSLHISISKFINKTRECIETRPNEEHISHIFNNSKFRIEDRRGKHSIFTIDPAGSMDFDDGFSITKSEHLGNTGWKVSVYIANVYFWLETFGLWKSFSKRVATIYLPDRRRPMLPTILSESLCSLQKQQDRFAFVMDVMLDTDGKLLEDTATFSNALINVDKNYVYEDPKMVETDTNYKNLFGVSTKMDKSILNSHDIVSHWMVIMNRLCGNFMAKNTFGIFRSSTYLNHTSLEKINKPLKEETARMIRMWNNVSGQYVVYSPEVYRSHDVMNLKSYIHITSPIRRLVDLLNQMMMFMRMGLIREMSQDAKEFLDDWLNKIDYINTSMRSIRKIQTDCDLVHRCFTDPEIMNKEHVGVVFDKIAKNDLFSYMVYLENIKLLSRITTREDIENYSSVNFKLFLFEDENKIKKKIRLHIVTNDAICG
jgi:exoribonuclease R